jgi:hypothetical protein
MGYSRTLIIAALVCSTAAAGPEPVTCDSPCDCHDAHGEGRWSVKTDVSASELLQQIFGKEKNPCRSVCGVAGLPLGVPVDNEPGSAPMLLPKETPVSRAPFGDLVLPMRPLSSAIGANEIG